MNRRPLLSLAANALGTLMRIVPRRHRFALGLRGAIAAAPLVRRTRLYAHRPSTLDDEYDATARLVIRAMDRVAVTFDVHPHVIGEELIPPGAAIFVSGHFLLNGVFVRWLHDRGERVTVIKNGVDPRQCIVGTRTRLDALQLGPNVLLEARQRLAAGHKVMVALDNADEDPRGVRVETPAGPRWIVDPIFRFAERLGVPVFFYATGVDGSRIVTTIRRPAANDAAARLHEFCAFFLDHITRRAGTRPSSSPGTAKPSRP